MTTQDQQELYRVLVEAFPGIPSERGMRCIMRATDLGLQANTIREAIWEHRHSYSLLDEPVLLGRLRSLASPEADAADRQAKAREAAAERQRQREAEEKAAAERWAAIKAKLDTLPAERLEAARKAAIEAAKPEARDWLARARLTHPMVQALIWQQIGGAA